MKLASFLVVLLSGVLLGGCLFPGLGPCNPEKPELLVSGRYRAPADWPGVPYTLTIDRAARVVTLTHEEDGHTVSARFRIRTIRPPRR